MCNVASFSWSRPVYDFGRSCSFPRGLWVRLICSAKPLFEALPFLDPHRIVASRHGRPTMYRDAAAGIAHKMNMPCLRQMPAASKTDPIAHRKPVSISPPIVLPYSRRQSLNSSTILAVYIVMPSKIKTIANIRFVPHRSGALSRMAGMISFFPWRRMVSFTVAPRQPAYRLRK